MRMHHLSGTDEKGRTYAMTYEEARSYIEYTDTMGSVLGLDSIKELLRRLGDPQDAVPVIHIAGTNGKGSICAFLDEILESAGYSVGRYISPTIFTYLERFQIDKEYMSEEDFAVYLETVKDAADDMVSDGWGRPTSFETETAVAFCYFCDKKVDFLLLETGMGGLEDATNVCSHPVCTIIASISMDHMHFLGNTLRDIYRQKLGILKKNCPCVAYPLASELEDMWDMACEQNNISDLAVLIREKDIEICGESVGGSVISSAVPTVPLPSSSSDATLSKAVFSISAIIAGVANTSIVPLPIAFAVLSKVTVISFLPLIPACNISVSLYLYFIK